MHSWNIFCFYIAVRDSVDPRTCSFRDVRVRGLDQTRLSNADNPRRHFAHRRIIFAFLEHILFLHRRSRLRCRRTGKYICWLPGRAPLPRRHINLSAPLPPDGKVHRLAAWTSPPAFRLEYDSMFPCTDGKVHRLAAWTMPPPTQAYKLVGSVADGRETT